MKIIFLDHQGVMHLNAGENFTNELRPFDTACVDILNSILKSDSSIEIVISSDWRYWQPLEEMKKFYIEQGIIRPPIAYTPMTRSIKRHLEIREYLRATAAASNVITHYVVIDDLDLRQMVPNFVWISDPAQGLKMPHIKEEILKILNESACIRGL